MIIIFNEFFCVKSLFLNFLRRYFILWKEVFLVNFYMIILLFLFKLMNKFLN